MPRLNPANRDAVRIWRLTESQVITVGMGEPVSVNQVAVWMAIERYRAAQPQKCFEKVLDLWSEVTMPRLKGELNGE
jgi:hypothetical protein